MPAWPQLSWLAVVTPTSEVILVYHGSVVDGRRVRTRRGGRIRDGQLTFVSSGATVDRLQSLRTVSGTRVSNLKCLQRDFLSRLQGAWPTADLD